MSLVKIMQDLVAIVGVAVIVSRTYRYFKSKFSNDQDILDMDKVCLIVSERTGIDLETVTRVINSETDYLVEQGIVELIER